MQYSAITTARFCRNNVKMNRAKQVKSSSSLFLHSVQVAPGQYVSFYKFPCKSVIFWKTGNGILLKQNTLFYKFEYFARNLQNSVVNLSELFNEQLSQLNF